MKSNIENVKLPFRTRLKKRIELGLRKKKQIVGLIVLGVIASIIISFFLTKYYRANGKIFFVYNTVNNSLLQVSGNLDDEINLFYDASFTENVIQLLSKKGFSLTRSELSEAQEVLVDKGASSILLQVTSDDPSKTTEIANAIIDEFFEVDQLNNLEFYLNARKVISDREKSLQESMNQDLNMQQGAVISSLSLAEENLITQISEFESELESIELDNQIYSFELERLINIFEKKFPILSQELLFINDQKLNNLLEKLERMQAVKNIMSVSQKLGGFSVQYLWPEIYDIGDITETEKEFYRELVSYLNENYSEKIAENEKFLNKLLEKFYSVQINVNGIDLTISTIFNNINALESRFNRIPFGKIEEARQSRLKKFNNSFLLKIRLKQANLIEKEDQYFAQIDYINEAEVPGSYFSPNLILNIFLGAIAGLILGLLVAFSSNSVKIEMIASANDLDEHGFKLLSQVPSLSPGSPILIDALNQGEKKKMDPEVIQSFTSIETFLKYGSLDKPLKSVLITSGQQGEGKSFIASNVAIALANSGNKVLLVDANLKFPVLYKFFKIKSTPSIAHFLFRKKELDEIIRKTYNKNLDLITCIEFPQNPSVIITSERMKNFMDQVKPKYDYIVYDSSSLSTLKETVSLLKSMDEVIIVVRCNKTKLSELFALQSLLNENDQLDFNIILNDVKL